ncbi:MAG: four-carbon acid sugar kinase family protein [Desulfobacterales bacterium]|nr:four-carbon acid sugar kinase family protein [Desulfobacterales bacterium]
MPILLGAIGDDFTGSTDLALMLSKNGMPAVQYIGVPADAIAAGDMPAAVIALKSRTVPKAEAVSQSLAACSWLLAQGARQIFFKYCSTFDSTEKGNIGPVAEALLNFLGDKATIVCPAFPANHRTVYQGHLFVGDRLLSESSMRDHPLTPMTDANLVRFLGRQLGRPESAGLISIQTVEAGPAAIQEKLTVLADQGTRFAVADAISEKHLMDIGAACANLKLITGGSGVALGLPDNFRKAGLLRDMRGLAALPRIEGPAVVIAGSCSSATRGQVRRMARTCPAFKIDPVRLAQGKQRVESVLAWASEAMVKGPVLIYSSAEPDEVADAQKRLGTERAGELIERAFAEIARQLAAGSVQKLIVAGGETAGAVVAALGIQALYIGPEIEPGVPWTFCKAPETICLALKSGNFGGENFFEKALGMLP